MASEKISISLLPFRNFYHPLFLPSKNFKSLENGDIVWNDNKKFRVFFFFFSKLQQIVSETFFVLVKSYSISPVCLQPIMKIALFLRFLRSLTYLITLSLEKEIIVLEKNLEKVLNLFPGICAKD